MNRSRWFGVMCYICSQIHCLAVRFSVRQIIIRRWFQMVNRWHGKKMWKSSPVDWFVYVQLDHRFGSKRKFGLIGEVAECRREWHSCIRNLSSHIWFSKLLRCSCCSTISRSLIPVWADSALRQQWKRGHVGSRLMDVKNEPNWTELN